MFGRRQRTSRERYEGNPLYEKQKQRWVSRRTIVFVCILFFISLAWGGVMIFSSMFQITSVSLPSLLFIPNKQLDATVQGLLNERHYGIIPQRSFWGLNVHEFTEELHARYPFASFAITKTYPNTLTIALREPIYLFDWVTGDGNEYYVDREGSIVYQVPKPIVLTVEARDVVTEGAKNNPIQIPSIPERFLKERTIAFPLIFDPQKRYTGIDARVATKELVVVLEGLGRAFARTTGVIVAYSDISTRPDHIRVVTEEGWTVLWNEQDDVDKQMQRLVTLLREKLNDTRSNLEYVDLRFGDKLYYKVKK